MLMIESFFLYQACYHIGFTHQLSGYVSPATHFDDPPLHRRSEFAFKNNGIPRENITPETAGINPDEVWPVIIRVGNAGKYQDSARLRHSFQLQDARHYRVTRKVSEKELLVDRHILDANATLRRLKFQNPIYQKHRIAVGQAFKDFFDLNQAETTLPEMVRG